MRLYSRGLIRNLIKIYKDEERSPEELQSYLSNQGINIGWNALIKRWERV